MQQQKERKRDTKRDKKERQKETKIGKKRGEGKNLRYMIQEPALLLTLSLLSRFATLTIFADLILQRDKQVLFHFLTAFWLGRG